MSVCKKPKCISYTKLFYAINMKKNNNTLVMFLTLGGVGTGGKELLLTLNFK